MSAPIPDNGFVILMGAMKAGTTSLYDYLQAHPAICPSVIKEPEYFTQNQHHGVAKRGISVRQYSDIWSFDASVHKYALEASTGYTKLPQEPGVAKRIFDSGIRPKFIYILRDPFERFLSHRNFIKNKAWAAEETFEVMVGLSNYYMQLAEYTQYFSKDDILILDFEELTRDPKTVTQKAFRFLGLPEQDGVDAFTAQNVTRRESGFEQRMRQSKLQQFFKLLPKPLRRQVNTWLTRLPASKEGLSRQERAQIHEKLADDMLKLQDVFGVDVTRWGFGAPTSVSDVPNGNVENKQSASSLS